MNECHPSRLCSPSGLTRSQIIADEQRKRHWDLHHAGWSSNQRVAEIERNIPAADEPQWNSSFRIRTCPGSCVGTRTNQVRRSGRGGTSSRSSAAVLLHGRTDGRSAMQASGVAYRSARCRGASWSGDSEVGGWRRFSGIKGCANLGIWSSSSVERHLLPFINNLQPWSHQLMSNSSIVTLFFPPEKKLLFTFISVFFFCFV